MAAHHSGPASATNGNRPRSFSTSKLATQMPSHARCSTPLRHSARRAGTDVTVLRLSAHFARREVTTARPSANARSTSQ